jgi:hypothetical protein
MLAGFKRGGETDERAYLDDRHTTSILYTTSLLHATSRPANLYCLAHISTCHMCIVMNMLHIHADQMYMQMCVPRHFAIHVPYMVIMVVNCSYIMII